MKVVFVANVDWFFQSHFAFLATKARDDGAEVYVAAQVTERGRGLEAIGLRMVPLPASRSGLVPKGIFRSAATLATFLKKQDGDVVVHGFGTFGIFVVTLARLMGARRPAVFTITGRGYSAIARTFGARVVRGFTRVFCSAIADAGDVRWVAENQMDLASNGLGAAVKSGRTLKVGGAGIDLDLFHVRPLPQRPPFRIGLVARLIWSKGIDTAVEAVRICRQSGCDVELTLAGRLDPGNPRGFTEAEVRAFAAAPGISWLGQVDDIDGFWAGQHLALLPSRGGEGLPKSLLEAAACGRAVLTADVAGCAEFAEATGGWVVAPDDAAALADMMMRIASRGDLAERGARARAAVAARFTQEQNWQMIRSFYRQLLAV